VVAHLCDRVAIVQDGGFVEIVTREELLKDTVTHPYTRQLMDGSRGYVSKRDARLSLASTAEP
jgi:ABC-type dipeptide/oligopeptide/nickel transport system ATPase subunit